MMYNFYHPTGEDLICDENSYSSSSSVEDLDLFDLLIPFSWSLREPEEKDWNELFLEAMAESNPKTKYSLLSSLGAEFGFLK